MIYDSHCHLDLMDNMVEIIKDVSESSLGIFAVGTTPKSYIREIEFCKNIPNIYVGLGMHPQLASSGYDDMFLFEKLVKSSSYIGEVGLDFGPEYFETKELQVSNFSKVIRLCEMYGNKVISIHSLKSTESVIDIIEKNHIDRNNTYIFHWFTGTLMQLKRAVDLGAYFSINPRMLRTKSGIEIIKNIPLNRILIETDAPFAVNVISVNDIEQKLSQLVTDISKIMGYDVREILENNARQVYQYKCMQ